MKVWATKILSEFQHYVEAGQAGVKERCNSLIVAIKGVYTYLLSSYINKI